MDLKILFAKYEMCIFRVILLLANTQFMYLSFFYMNLINNTKYSCYILNDLIL